MVHTIAAVRAEVSEVIAEEEARGVEADFVEAVAADGVNGALLS